MSHEPGAVLFDLDGTLLDTAPDMHAALNRLLAENDRAPLPFDAVRNHVSHGSHALVTLAFPDAPDEQTEALKKRYLEIYARDLCIATALFPGMDALLNEIEARGWRWGVVTNKPAWLTEPLLEALGLAPRMSAIVSGDSLNRRKPDPDPMWLAARQTGLEPAHHCYWGDAERDIAAGRAAGMSTLIAAWGYIDAGQNTDGWGADGVLDHPGDFWGWRETFTRAAG
ncbi:MULTISPECIES: phosphoglycolate phosphatase [Thioalkalivibrio]|uniref:phosphoglycolate phosphatase n=1 Tax=Thioalkalivibrio halophilus TaxID=252474 RepID=A0A1V2ZZQ2_9GAMM|nr:MULTISPECIES: phosphoglycolate phosphatase [Thioalkalivibrio]OOC10549.1 phosphoglycolate phosphatase, bacterial [Thioalkalivibrio halophilus]PYF99964.1 phosphoglycolate phosphatase [Thioalkalivibrio sp. ALE21]